MSSVDDLLLRYVTGDLADDEEAAFEARLFEDEALAKDAARLWMVRELLRGMGARGPIVPVVTDAELRALRARVVITDHHPRDGVITSRIGEEDFVAAHVPLQTDAARVHVVLLTADGEPYFRVHEAPWERGAGEIILLCHREVAVATGRLHVKVVDDADAELAAVIIENRAASDA
jgi:anti-sigma factor RsiW